MPQLIKLKITIWFLNFITTKNKNFFKNKEYHSFINYFSSIIINKGERYKIIDKKWQLKILFLTNKFYF